MSFLSRRFRFCDGTCQQGHRLQARELLATTVSTRLTHNSPVSESDADDNDDLISYVPMNFFNEQGDCTKSNSRYDCDQVQLPVTTVLEQFQLGEGDRKWESNKIAPNAEQTLDDGHNHVSGDVFQWSCSPPSSQEKGTMDLAEKKKTLGFLKKSLGTGKLKTGVGKMKNYPIAATTEELSQDVPARNDLMVIGTNCETFNKKVRISFMMEN